MPSSNTELDAMLKQLTSGPMYVLQQIIGTFLNTFRGKTLARNIYTPFAIITLASIVLKLVSVILAKTTKKRKLAHQLSLTSHVAMTAILGSVLLFIVVALLGGFTFKGKKQIIAIIFYVVATAAGVYLGLRDLDALRGTYTVSPRMNRFPLDIFTSIMYVHATGYAAKTFAESAKKLMR